MALEEAELLKALQSEGFQINSRTLRRVRADLRLFSAYRWPHKTAKTARRGFKWHLEGDSSWNHRRIWERDPSLSYEESWLYYSKVCQNLFVQESMLIIRSHFIGIISEHYTLLSFQMLYKVAFMIFSGTRSLYCTRTKWALVCGWIYEASAIGLCYHWCIFPLYCLDIYWHSSSSRSKCCPPISWCCENHANAPKKITVRSRYRDWANGWSSF